MAEEARRLSILRGVDYTLDHEIPLNHPAVCGLNVPWNLKIVPRATNLSKGNRWHPDQYALSLPETSGGYQRQLL